MQTVTKKQYIITSFLFEKIDSSKDVSALTKKVKKSRNGYAGFKSRTGLYRYLDTAIGNPKKLTLGLSEQKTVQSASEAIKKCQKYFPIKKCDVFLFPTYDPFVLKKMFGVNGFTPWQSTILLFIHSGCKNLKYIQYTLAHEYAHAAMLNYHKWESLEDSLFFEGIAEHFRERVLGGREAPWVKALSQKKSKQLYKKLQNKLKSKDPSLYGEIFLGKGKVFPLWSGYAIGYYMVGKILKKSGGLFQLIKKPRIR
ncbi:MAG: hypothetical protein COT24_02305 [Candidatus Kerfeldbacteria bacterium CG08_land_8_20_14_0_20_40_16]|uniref:DUF2268 domain-containing protein n=1 Tax=Candidatus Kerfeldbacteria bacterium CG08_land_8_20_14_0_20_40_16 TaxID=2014244 RepID=A0A2H0YY47_9BACT|nr:MAG: hypothetical protein COT24_02305 [Candidatus Kerfeldbacteria bacterium CG08_land_8_20_14_0_20_40_16]